DGFGHPFQYAKSGPDGANTTYDLWSFAESPPPDRVDKATKQGIAAEKWLKNW
ncbi:MAG: hypothetical protein JWO94_770, partial [Verrucomicrobiaceae bacterium]|nr:hypothetical protein [Verrucomicrobiaceae bacterium]